MIQRGNISPGIISTAVEEVLKVNKFSTHTQVKHIHPRNRNIALRQRRVGEHHGDCRPNRKVARVGIVIHFVKGDREPVVSRVLGEKMFKLEIKVFLRDAVFVFEF